MRKEGRPWKNSQRRQTLYFAEGLLQHQKSLLKEIQSLQPDTTDTETSPADTDEAVTNPQAEPGEAPANVAP